MIFYFSGTGNSKHIAELAAEATGEKLISIAECVQNDAYGFEAGERVGFVFPIYAWAPPLFVSDFFKKLTLSGAENAYFFTLYVCGAETGNGHKLWRKEFDDKGWKLSLEATLPMPDNYILMYDVVSEEKQKEKIAKAEEMLKNVLPDVVAKAERHDIIKGSLAWLKTKLITPSFQKYMMNAEGFHIEGDCTHCGLCVKNCPCQNIKDEDGQIVWGENCAMCLSCLHRCAARVVQYGNKTQNRGRYYFK